jgi:DNA-binding protein YbaB
MTAENAEARLAAMREGLADARLQLDAAQFTGRSDDERITATVSSTGHLVALELDPRVRRLDSQTLADSILLATNRARSEAHTRSTEMLRRILGTSVDLDALRSGEGLGDMITAVGRHLRSEHETSDRGGSH